MQRQKILVTGGTGYIGSHICITLISKYDLIVVDNLSNSDASVVEKIKRISGRDEITFYAVDLRDKTNLDAIFQQHAPYAVIHCAGLKSVRKSITDPLTYYQNNVSCTISLLEVMDEHDCNKLIFSSSGTVYGKSVSPLSEESNVGTGITNPYGKTKFMTEQILEDVSASNKKWHIVSLRYFNPIGAHHSGLISESLDTPNNLMPVMLKAIIDDATLRIYGNDYDTDDGYCVRDFVHVMDLAEGHMCALEKIDTLQGWNAYNLGTGKGISVMELIRTFMATNNVEIKYEIADRRDGDVAASYCDSSKAKKDLNWEARSSLETMCRDSYRSLRR